MTVGFIEKFLSKICKRLIIMSLSVPAFDCSIDFLNDKKNINKINFSSSLLQKYLQSLSSPQNILFGILKADAALPNGHI